MSSEVPEIVSELRTKVNLVGLFLMKSYAEFLGIVAGDVPDEIKWGVQTTGGSSTDQPNTIRVRVGVMAILRVNKGNRDVARIGCDFSLDYQVTEPTLFAKLAEQDFGTFASTNGFYNAWPFVRELCRDLTARMPLPAPVVLPLVTTPLALTDSRPWGDFGELLKER